MPDLPKQGPPDEQSICVRCGFCCDGTLFSFAGLNPGERGRLPERIEEQAYCDGDKDYFRLPCHYFSEKCTIYDQVRADICGSYRCQLLMDFADGKVALNDALEIVREAVNMRTEINEEYRRVSGKRGDDNFKKILAALGKVQRTVSGRNPLSTDYEMLLVRCNIFEALLIKNFRSAEAFEKMLIE